MASIVFDRPEAWWVAGLLLLVSVGSLWWTARKATAHWRSAPGMIVIGLRCLALLSIVAALLQPVFSWASSGHDRGTVAILVDASASMTAVDTQRSTSDQVALASALGLLPSDARRNGFLRIRELIDKAKAARDSVSRVSAELAYAKLARLDESTARSRLSKLTLEAEQTRNAALIACRDERGTSAVQQFLIASLDSPQSAERFDTYDAALTVLDRLQATADAQLFDQRKDVRLACANFAAASRISLVDQAVNSSAGLIAQLSGAYHPKLFSCGNAVTELRANQTLKADETSTNLLSALRDVRRQLVGQRLVAIVLLTDGRQTETMNQEPANTGETPLFSVQVAEQDVPDLAVTRLESPSSIRLGDSCPVSVELTARAMPNARGQLTLDDGNMGRTREVSFARPTTQASFAVTFEHAGVSEISASLQPDGKEATARNNTLKAAVKVTDDVARVCLIDGLLDPTALALRRTLRGLPGMQLQTFELWNVPTAEQISAADTVILHQLPAAALSDDLWTLLVQQVTERGLSVLIINDSEDTFADYQESPAIRPLLPWSDEQSPSAQQSRPGSEASIHLLPIDRSATINFRLSDDPDEGRSLWRKMPPLSSILTFPPPQTGSHALLIEADSRAPVLTESWLGAGRVLIFGSNELWRWSGEKPVASRFIKRLAEAVVGSGYVADDGELSLDVNRLILPADQTQTIRTRLRNIPESELDDIEEPPHLRVRRGSEVVADWTLEAPTDRSSRRVQFSLPYLNPGSYTVDLTWGQHYLSDDFQISDSMDSEMRNVSGDDTLLQDLVGTNGALLKLRDLPSLRARIDAVSSPAPVKGHYRLWDSPYLFALTVSCLTLEWSLRARMGLP